MFTRPKGWLTGAIWKPKNLHSLEHLKFLYGVLCKNQTVTEQNKSLLVETLRSISEILIWGDQNDSSVFDFFLEKNMLAFFLRFMRQKSGRYICVQLLQTLNILFENISNETSVYYLLSNNHINSIIVHKFDFSDEEVMAYYISFLKTLSLKLNKHTIHFFYNEHTNDFALYTEAIKFFNHPESMVRIAVRTITLNVYKVDDKSMLRYIRDKTAAPYFSNLVWFIGNHIIELDSCVRNDADHNSRDRLADLVAEHLDHLHYLNDILCLKIDALNEVLTDHLLNRLLIPLYVYSLTKRRKFSARTDDRPHVSSVVSLFLLSQVFLIISHSPLVRQLADIIFNGDMNVCMADMLDTAESPLAGKKSRLRGFVKPAEPLAKTLESNRGPGKPMKRPNFKNAEESAAAAAAAEKAATSDATTSGQEETETEEERASSSEQYDRAQTEEDDDEEETPQPAAEVASPGQNSTDEEKLLQGGAMDTTQLQTEFSLTNRPYLEAVFSALGCTDNDYGALFALCLLYAVGHNLGINQELLDSVLMPTDASVSKDHYNVMLIEKLIHIIHLSCQNSSKIRLATLEMTILLLRQLVYRETQCYLQDRHLASVEGAREESTLLLRNFYKSEEIFLDMFEDEYREMKIRPLNVEYLMMDASILLPPTGTPLTGIDFNKRLPCGEVERARRAIRVFFMLRDLSLTLRQEDELALPLTKQEECVKVNDVLDLNNSDLIACTVMTRDQQSKRERRFLVIDLLQLILVEPDTRRLGWGVVKFVGFLQDVEVTGDKDDSRSLHITIHKPSMNMHARPLPLLSARFIFDDHIRCMAAKQRLTKGRLKARQRKMQMIARLLELPTHIVDAIYHAPQYPQSATSLRTSQPPAAPMPGRLLRHPGQAQGQRSHGNESRMSEKAKRSATKRGLSQPIPIRAPAGGAVRQNPTGNTTNANSSHTHKGSPEIEEAEEATPSPEAHAFQSLNPSYEMTQESKNGRGSRSSSGDRLPNVQEIPLEDLSRRGKAAKASRRRGEKRSNSASPHRLADADVKSPSPQGSPLASRAKDPATRARIDLCRRRAGSLPLTKDDEGKDSAPEAKPAFTEDTTSDPAQDDLKQGIKASSNEDNVDGEIEDAPGPEEVIPNSRSYNRSRSSSGSGVPPSLTPAPEPPGSLLPPLDIDLPASLSAATDSPKLIPPIEAERIRSLSDPTHQEASGGNKSTESCRKALAMDTETDDVTTVSTSPPVSTSPLTPESSPESSPNSEAVKPKPPFTISGKCPIALEENETAADGERAVEESGVNATEQLSKVAQKSTSAPPLSEDPNDMPMSPTATVSDEENKVEQ